MRSLALIILGVLSVSCCAPCSKSAPKIGELESATWTLIEFRDSPIENSPITLNFNAEQKTLYGTALCNNFFAGYTLYDDPRHNIRFSNVGATMKYCPDMEIEQKFTSTLPSVTQVKLETEYLLMIDSTGTMVAVLAQSKM